MPSPRALRGGSLFGEVAEPIFVVEQRAPVVARGASRRLRRTRRRRRPCSARYTPGRGSRRRAGARQPSRPVRSPGRSAPAAGSNPGRVASQPASPEARRSSHQPTSMLLQADSRQASRFDNPHACPRMPVSQPNCTPGAGSKTLDRRQTSRGKKSRSASAWLL